MVRLQRRMGTHNVQSEGPFVTKPNPPRGTRVLKRAHKLVLLLALVVSVGVGAWFLSARLSGPGPRQVALSDAVAQIQHPAATGLSTVWVDDTDHTVTLDTRAVPSSPPTPTATRVTSPGRPSTRTSPSGPARRTTGGWPAGC